MSKRTPAVCLFTVLVFAALASRLSIPSKGILSAGGAIEFVDTTRYLSVPTASVTTSPRLNQSIEATRNKDSTHKITPTILNAGAISDFHVVPANSALSRTASALAAAGLTPQFAKTSVRHHELSLEARERTGPIVLSGHTGPVRTAVFSPDGQRIITGSDDGTGRIWNASTGQVLVTLESHSGGVRHAEFSPDGQRVVTSFRGASQTWNAVDGRLLATFKGSSNARFSPDGHRIVAPNTDSGTQTLVIWDAVSGRELLRLVGQSATVLEAWYSPDGRMVVAINSDGTANVWDAANGKPVVAIRPKAAFSRDLQRLLTTTVIDGATTVQVWSAPTDQDQLLAEMKVEGVREAKFSPNGNRILTINRDDLGQIWDAASGQLLATSVNLGIRPDATFSPDGQRLVTTSVGNTARVWDAGNWRLLASLEGHSSRVLTAAFSPDGRRIVTASLDRTARIWNIDAMTGGANPTTSQEATTHYKEGRALTQKGDLDGAIAEYRTALRLKPTYAEAHYALAWLLAKKGDGNGATTEFLTAVRLKPDFAEAHLALGMTLQNAVALDIKSSMALQNAVAKDVVDEAPRQPGDRRLDDAISEYRFALRLKSNYPEAHFWLGSAFDLKGSHLNDALAEYKAALRLNPDYADAHYNMGRDQARMGDLDGAVHEYRETLRLKRDTSEVHDSLGEALEKKGDLDGAIAEYRYVLNATPDSMRAHCKLGAALRKKGGRSLNEAIEEYRDALSINSSPLSELDPSYKDARSGLDWSLLERNLGWAVVVTNDMDKTIAGYRQAVRLKLGSAEAHYNLGKALRQRSQMDATEEDLNADMGVPEFGGGKNLKQRGQKDVKDVDEAIQEFREALRLKPDFAEAHFGLGWALHEQGDPEAAIREYKETLRLRPDYVYVHAHIGWALGMTGDLDHSLSEFRELLQTLPDDPQVHYTLGWALREKGYSHFKEALAEFREAKRLKPGFANAELAWESLFMRRIPGQAPLQKDDQYTGIARFLEVVRMEPGNAEAYYGLGWAFERKDDLGPSIAAFRRVLGLKPDYAEAHCSLGYALWLAGSETAAEEFHEALRLRPDFAEAHYGLGLALRDKAEGQAATTARFVPTVLDEKGKQSLNGAVAEFQEALRLSPGYAEAHFGLGWALGEKGDADGEIREYREALLLNPGNPYWHARLGWVLDSKGDPAGATIEYHQAVQLDPTFPRATLQVHSQQPK